MSSGDVFIRDNTEIDLFDGVFELIHEHIGIGLVDGLLLVLVDADKREADALDVEIVNHWMSEEIVCIENHGFDCGIVKCSIGVNREILILIPGVPNNETGGEVIGSIQVLGECRSRRISVSHLAEEMASRGSEEESSCFFKLHHNEALSKWNSCTWKSVCKVTIEPEQ
jgi:hypothetical protein